MADEFARTSPTDAVRPQTAFAVQFVFEVESRAVAERIRSRLPDPEEPGIATDGYRSYVDSAGLDRPAVGASVPCRDQYTAELLYARIADTDEIAESVRSGTLTLRQYEGVAASVEAPTVVAVTRYP